MEGGKYEFTDFREAPIDQGKWEAIKQLLEDAARDDSQGRELRELFEDRSEKNKEKKLEVLRERGVAEGEADLRENLHPYLESIFHDSPLKFWWW